MPCPTSHLPWSVLTLLTWIQPHTHTHTHMECTITGTNEHTYVDCLALARPHVTFFLLVFIIVLLARKSLPAMCGKKKRKGEREIWRKKKGGSGEKESNRKERRICLCSSSFNVSAWVINEHMNGRNCLHLF